MVYKLAQSIIKEFLLLKRDIGGLLTLFVMPLILVITVTIIQDSTFKSATQSKIQILLVDNDHGKIAQSVFENLGKSHSFEVISQVKDKKLTESLAQELVNKGEYQLAIVIPENLSKTLQNKIEENVTQIVNSVGMNDSVTSISKTKSTPKEVKLYFDPAVQNSFKDGVMNAVDKMISQIETQTIYSAFQEQLGEETIHFQEDKLITFKEIVPKINNQEIRPNSVQHNVPAWTLFAIFFIVIPLSINIVKEKSQGTFVRLLTNPVSNAIVLGGKTVLYLVICLIQFLMMLALAVYFFPQIGLPPLHLNGHLFLMTVVTLFAGLAAIGFGLLIGTFAKTQEQSAPFGATSVIILAAIGGVWVPVFAMPKIMQVFAKASPMNWGLEAYYDVLLRQASFLDILPNLSLLFLFFLFTTSIALYYEKKKRAV
ncbi:ABC transporter permease [Flavobacterium agrisoli]|uniref:ABC transporter permease n=1 Tax=Flavobacterium agrisoli TaxID=2793066 RepID=A0A934UJ44_9FLAO|nr:ABC transporter permease [Flavobacterium agrisoli]MBK0369527.1 ABC transporter permease [Flavobacterium agrisoli]